MYKPETNGYQYIANGKTGKFWIERDAVKVAKGQVVSIEAEGSTVKAVIALQVSPSPGCLTSTYMSETIDAIDGTTIQSSKVKNFTIR